jgi:hypothetical protein
MYQQFCFLYCDRAVITNNYDVANMTMKLYNDGIHDTVFNTFIEFKSAILNLKADVKLMGEEYENDKNFERELFRTSVDLGRAMKGIQGNYLLRGFFDVLIRSAGNGLKLLFNKVLFEFLFIHSIR